MALRYDDSAVNIVVVIIIIIIIIVDVNLMRINNYG